MDSEGVALTIALGVTEDEECKGAILCTPSNDLATCGANVSIVPFVECDPKLYDKATTDTRITTIPVVTP